MKFTFKRFLALALALVMTLGMVPNLGHSHVHAEELDVEVTEPVHDHDHEEDTQPVGEVAQPMATPDGTLSVENLTVTYENLAGNASSCALDGTTITATAQSKSGFSAANRTAGQTQVTLEYTGSAASVSFNYTGNEVNSLTIDGETYNTESGSFTKTVTQGTKIVIVFASATGGSFSKKTATLTITDVSVATEKNVNVTFNKVDNGTYTVGGNAINSNTTISKKSTESFAVKATPAADYLFYGWYNETTGKYIAFAAETALTLTDDAIVYPVFVHNTTAMFGVGTNTFISLTEAGEFAASSTIKTIVLLNNGTVSGSHTIPAGVTLLVPFDSGNTLYTSKPKCTSSAFNNVDWVQPTAYRTLTLAADAHITVNGAISISGQHAASNGGKPYCGAPTGPVGWVKMLSGSQITLNSGANLYCWGFIQGAGTITANSGATVYENFQFTDFRGGSNLTAITNEGLVFPINQYYVQNIEVPVKFYDGAKETLYTSAYASNFVLGGEAPFIGEGGMFVVKNGYIIKDYIENRDRMQVDVYGDITMSSMTVEVSVKVDSSKYVLPITNNITVNLHSGTATAQQSIALLPGAEMTVGKNAVLVIAGNETALNDYNSGGFHLIVYDYDEWTYGIDMTTEDMVTGVQYAFGSSINGMYPLPYAPGRTYNRTVANDLKDAVLNVNGTIVVSGGLYTTLGGGKIYTSQGTGTINMLSGSGTDIMTFQANGGTSLMIPMNSASLMNADGTYLPTGPSLMDDTIPATDPGTIFTYCNMHGWHPGECKECASYVEITFVINGESFTQEFAVGQIPVYNGSIAVPKSPDKCHDYDFIGWATTEGATSAQYGENELPPATENATYYAVYSRVTNANHDTTKFDYTDNGNGTHKKVLACCGELVKADETCSGGTATCEGKPVCQYCYAEYGTALGHSFGETVAAVTATCQAGGNVAYKQCQTCNLFFAADAAANSTEGKATNESFLTAEDPTNHTGKNLTYTNKGDKHDVLCECGKVYQAAQSHDFESGSAAHTCVCGATAHDHDRYTTTATTHQSVCSCGVALGEAEDHTDKTGDGDHKCDICGLDDENHVPNIEAPTCGADQICTECKEVLQKATGNHTYDNACDAECNVCKATRTPADHVYDNACDAECNVCKAIREVGAHVYDNACDAECNECGATRTPAAHVYDNDCDAECNVCKKIREVGEHVYDNACDAECNECGATRTPADHVYDNDCDAECNVCKKIREVGEHVYDNACDATCNECGDTRVVDGHVYDNACDAECNECGDTRVVDGHVYDNACDADCNECGATRTPADHVYDNDCDAECNVCKEIREVGDHSFTTNASDKLASEADCDNAATYYVQCDHCDAVNYEMTVAVGSAKGHGETYLMPNHDGTHDVVCSVCAEPTAENVTCTVDESETYYDVAAHASCCVAGSEYEYTSCECGYKFEPKLLEDTIPATGEHTLVKSELTPTCLIPGWKAYWTCNNMGFCYEDAEGKTKIDDISAWLAEGGEGHLPVDPTNHESDAVTYTDNGNGTHSATYDCCGADYVTDKAHDYGDDHECVCGANSHVHAEYKNLGNGKHQSVCSCGEYLGEAADHSFTNKPSNVEYSPADCINPAKNYVQCDYCDAVSDTETVAVGEKDPTNHTNSAGAGICPNEDGKTHRIICGGCEGIIEEKEEHNYHPTSHTCICGAVEEFTITLMVDGEQYGEVLNVAYGAAINLPTPEKAQEGCTTYTFAGWNETVPATMPATNLTFTGSFTEGISHTSDKVTYTNNGDTHSATYDCCGAAYVTNEAHDYKYDAANHKCVCGAVEQIRLSFYALSNPTGFAIVVPYNTVLTDEHMAEAPTPDVPVGEVFVGWFDDYGVKVDVGYVAKETGRVTAAYETATYTVTWLLNGGILDEQTKQELISKGFTVTDTSISKAIPYGDFAPNASGVTKTGHTLVGYTDQYGNFYEDHQFFTLSEDMTFTLVWEVNTYTLTVETYNVADDNWVRNEISVSYGEKLSDHYPEIPSFTGNDGLLYEFKLWNVWTWDGNDDNTIAEYTGETMPASDVKVHPSYTLTGWLEFMRGFTSYVVKDNVAYYRDEWATIDGAQYYFVFADDMIPYSYIVKDITLTTKDGVEGYYAFDHETGKWLADYTGVYEATNGDLYYVENGVAVANKGLVRVYENGEAKYYYFGDYTAVKDTVLWVEKNNDLLPKWDYTFDANGVIVHDDALNNNEEQHHAVVEYDGVKYYTIDGIKAHMGMVKLGEDHYIYVRGSGELVVNRTYWCTDVNDTGFEEGSYTFDADGKMVLNGIFNGYYYVEGVRTYAGLIMIDGYYYYVRTSGAVATGRYWITKANTQVTGFEPGSYLFAEDGKMILTNGFVDENGTTYYYKNGNKYYAGLIKIDGDWYYVKSSGEVVKNRTYWITKTNGYMPESSYTFDADGKMVDVPVIPDVEEGFTGIKDGYYYENGVITYAGLIKIDGNWYYVRSNGQVATGKYWITKTNGYMKQGSYTFDENGVMLNPPVV